MIKTVVRAVESVLPDRRPIGHHEPCLNGRETDYINQCIKEGIVGESWVQKLDTALAKYVGVDHAICTTSGTAAIHVALLAAGIQPGEEVLVPALTYVATANAVTYCGALPNFVDGSLGINAYKLRRYLERTTGPAPNRKGRLNYKTGRVISAIIVVDLLGFPADWDKLTGVCEEFGLIVIEDAAQALGASLGTKNCGSFGAVAAVSFNNNKIITGNGGGAVLTNDPWIAAKVWQLVNVGKIPHPWKTEHNVIGVNYRMDNLCASLALAQLEQIGTFIAAKRSLAFKYQEALPVSEGRMFMLLHEWQGTPNYWLSTYLLEPKNESQRDNLFTALHKKGIRARAMFTPLHKLPMYEGNPRDNNMLLCELTAARAICLPSGANLVQL